MINIIKNLYTVYINMRLLEQEENIADILNTPSEILTTITTAVSLLSIIWLVCKTKCRDI